MSYPSDKCSARPAVHWRNFSALLANIILLPAVEVASAEHGSGVPKPRLSLCSFIPYTIINKEIAKRGFQTPFPSHRIFLPAVEVAPAEHGPGEPGAQPVCHVHSREHHVRQGACYRRRNRVRSARSKRVELHQRPPAGTRHAGKQPRFQPRLLCVERIFVDLSNEGFCFVRSKGLKLND